MPRRSNDHTPAEPTGTPTDSSLTPTDARPAPLPKPPVVPAGSSPSRPPVAAGPPRPAAPVAAPPPPRLPPPSPNAPAKPGRRGEISSDLQMTARISRVPRDPTPAPLPPSPGARDAERWFEQVPTNPAVISELAENTGSHRKARRPSHEDAPSGPRPLIERPWVLPVLIAAIALTVGMILGGLLFGGGGDCPRCDELPAGTQAPKQ